MADRLRILHLCSAREYVGEAGRVVDLAQALRERGHEVEVIGRRSHSVVDRAGRRGLPCTAAHMRSRFHPWLDLSDVRLIRARIRTVQAHLVHTHRGKDHWLAAAALARLRARPALVRTRHVVTPIRAHAANRWLFSRATNGLVCVSEAVARAVAASGLRIPGPATVIPGGTDPRELRTSAPDGPQQLRRRLHIPEDAPVIGCLARLAPIKGQEYLVRALPRVLAAHPNAVCVFAFSRKSGYRDRLEDLVREVGVREAVRWVGQVERIGDFLRLAQVGVLASIGSEGWSRAAVEFMAVGRPVVATCVGSLPEIVTQGATGRLVPARDPEALAESITALLNDPSTSAALGEAGAARAARYYTIDQLADATVAFYRIVLADRKEADR